MRHLRLVEGCAEPDAAGAPAAPPPVGQAPGLAAAVASKRGAGPRPPRGDATPCHACLRRAWLVATLAARIEIARREEPRRLRRLLALPDADLMKAVGADRTDVPDRYRRFDSARAFAACEAARVTPLCRHDDRYPARLHELEDPPAVLHVAGRVTRLGEMVALDRRTAAIVGARRASDYGLEIARGLARGLAGADVTIVSGMALGVDAAAHEGALGVGGPTVAVLAGAAERPYPASKRRIHVGVLASGAVVSEMPPGAHAHRWCFPARNRIIAALGEATIVVEAAARSGSLITAEFARDLGRDVAAVPGRVTSPLAAGTNALLKDGAHFVTSTDDALDLLFGAGGGRPARTAPRVAPHLADVLQEIAAGRDSPEALVGSGERPVGSVLAALAELEIDGHVRRVAGGRYVPTT